MAYTENFTDGVKVVDSNKPKAKIIGKCGYKNQRDGEGFFLGGICWDDLLDAAAGNEYLTAGTNGKKYFTVKIAEHNSKQKDRYGNTHIILLQKPFNRDDL